MDVPIMKWKNDKTEYFMHRMNKRYGLKIPFIPGNDCYFGDIGIVMNVDTDDPKEALEKIFERNFSTEYVRKPMPLPFYLLKHFEFSMLYEPKGTLGIFF